MPIRQRIKNGVTNAPFEVEYALRRINNDLGYGKPNSTPDALLREAERWELAARSAPTAAKAGVFRRHSERYLSAAEVIEEYANGKGSHRPR